MKKILKFGVFAAAVLTISGLITLYNLGEEICLMARHLVSGLLPWVRISFSL